MICQNLKHPEEKRLPWDTERLGAKCRKMHPAKKGSKDLAVSGSIAFYLFRWNKITALGGTGHLSTLIAPSHWPFQQDYRNPLVEWKNLQFLKNSDFAVWYQSCSLSTQTNNFFLSSTCLQLPSSLFKQLQTHMQRICVLQISDA